MNKKPTHQYYENLYIKVGHSDKFLGEFVYLLQQSWVADDQINKKLSISVYGRLRCLPVEGKKFAKQALVHIVVLEERDAVAKAAEPSSRSVTVQLFAQSMNHEVISTSITLNAFQSNAINAIDAKGTSPSSY